MHYGWPLLRNLTLLSILTHWYSNNRIFRHNIQTASFPPLYYFVPHWVSIDVLSWCLLRQLAWHCGTCRRRYHLMHWKVVSCVVWAERGGWSRIFHQKAPKGIEFLHRDCQGWRSCNQNTDTYRAWWEVKLCSPRGVHWEWWRRLQCLDINWRSSPCV